MGREVCVLVSRRVSRTRRGEASQEVNTQALGMGSETPVCTLVGRHCCHLDPRESLATEAVGNV